MNNEKEITIDLGHIGHKADKLKAMFEGYSEEPNKAGYFLRFENYTHIAVNEGVMVYTNCFGADEKDFMEILNGKLLMNL